MILTGHRGWLRYTALSLLGALALMYGAPVLAADDTPAAQKKTLVVFPSDNPANVGASLLDALANSIKVQVHAAGVYQVVEYTPRLASLERALREQRLTEQDVRAPFDLAKGVTLGKEMGCDLFLVSSVEEYKYDKDKNAVSLILLAQIGDPKTGKLVGTATVTGAAADALGLREEEQLATLAAVDAVNQLAAGLFPKPEVIQQGPKKNKNLVWVLLSVAAAVLLASNKSEGGGGNENPPPPP